METETSWKVALDLGNKIRRQALAVGSKKRDSKLMWEEKGMGARPGLQKHKHLQCAVDFSETWRAENEAELGKNAVQKELHRKRKKQERRLLANETES